MFDFLDKSRDSSFGMSAIPLSEYYYFIKLFGCPYDVDYFVDVVRQIDIGFIKEFRKDRG